MSMIIASICLDDIPQEKITKSEKNGKRYVSIKVSERKEPSSWGSTHTVSVNQTRAEREAKATIVFIGDGKEYTFGGKEKQVPSAVSTPADDDDGFPF